jgi:type III secretory pathway lipoprotein EscJ
MKNIIFLLPAMLMMLVGCKNRITKNVAEEEAIEVKETVETKEIRTSIENKNQNLDVPPHYNLEDLPTKK